MFLERVARGERGLLALRRLRAGWADPDGLDVDELVDAELTQLTAVAAALHAAKGQPRIGCHDAVDEDRARLDLPSQRFSLVDSLRPDRGMLSLSGRGENRHGLRGTEQSATEAWRHRENLKISVSRCLWRILRVSQPMGRLRHGL